MQIRPRFDLPGYAMGLPAIKAMDGLVLDRPVTIFWGPNGCGKTSILRMMASITGLVGRGTGCVPMQAHERRLKSLEEARGDLGILAHAGGAHFSKLFSKQKREASTSDDVGDA